MHPNNPIFSGFPSIMIAILLELEPHPRISTSALPKSPVLWIKIPGKKLSALNTLLTFNSDNCLPVRILTDAAQFSIFFLFQLP